MSEAAVLALAAKLIRAMNIQDPVFLSDCQQLVSFLNKADMWPPHWNIKCLIQKFINHLNHRHKSLQDVKEPEHYGTQLSQAGHTIG